jgi:hypothetical protein
MTPEERELTADLFDRLAPLERNPRDPDAERAIREGLARAPNAVYALVQTVLLQDEALKRADQHIAELEEELARAGAVGRAPRGFLDNMRESLFGQDRDAPHGSVPSVRGGDRDRPMGAPAGYGSERQGSPWGSAVERQTPAGSPYASGSPYGPSTQGGPMAGPFGGSMGGAPSGGHSFLGTAAAVAAGAIGGSLLLGGIRSAMGAGQSGGPFSGAFDHLAGGQGGSGRAPLETGGGSDELARDAGIDDIGRSGRAGFADSSQEEGAGSRFGVADAPGEDVADNSDFEGDDSDLGGDSDTDTA